MPQCVADHLIKLHPRLDHESEEQNRAGTMNEVLVDELSGDEAMDEIFDSKDSMHPSQSKKNRKASLFLSGLIVTQSMVGVGILGLPNVAKNFGILPVTLLILFVFGYTNFSTYLLIQSKNMSRHSNYTTIGDFLYDSKTIVIIINLIIIFTNLGTCLSMLIIFGTTCENLVKVFVKDIDTLPFYLQRECFIIEVGILLIPLITVKSIHKLRIVSLIAVVSLTIFMTIIIWNFFRLLQYNKLPKQQIYYLFPTSFDFRQAFGALPVVMMEFAWHFNQFPIYKGMINPMDTRITKAAWIGSSLGTVLYLIVGILGYMSYGDKVEINFLKAIQLRDTGEPLYVILNIAFSLSNILTIPLLFYGSRNNCLCILNQIKCFPRKKCTAVEDTDIFVEVANLAQYQKETKEISKENFIDGKRQNIKFFVTSLVLQVMLIIGAINLTSLEVVFNLIGAIGSNSISTVIPALFFLKCVRKVCYFSLLSRCQKNLYHLVKIFLYYSLILVVVCVGSEILRILKDRL